MAQTLEVDVAHEREREVGRQALAGPGAEDDLARRTHAFEASSHVHGVAQHRVVHPAAATDIADHHGPAVEGHPDLDRPSAGRIAVAGQALEKMDENALAAYRRRVVGFIFQSFNLIPSLSAWENVAFPMRFAGVSRRERKRRADALLERVGLADRRQHRPSELSGGQQQRVAIARSLVNEPQLVLADEPTGNLDTASGQSIMDLLSELHADGRTVVVVTHDPRMAAYATHQVFLLDGCTVSAERYHTVTGMSGGEAIRPAATPAR